MASSDVIIRNEARRVLGREATESEVASGRSVDDAQLAEFFRSGGAENFLSSPEGILEASKRAATEFFQPFRDAATRAGEFEEKNPFSFDEALARASSEERFDPFFQAELGEFIEGVNLQRGRTVQDEESLRRELTASTESFVGRTGRQISQALESSREGFAGAGLFFGGRRKRAEGQIGIEGQEELATGLRKADVAGRESLLRQRRGLEDIGLQKKRGLRLQTAGRETALRTDVEQQRREAQQQRELERQQFIGFPLAGGGSSLSSIFNLG